MNLTLKNMGNSSELYTSWTEPPGGRDHYRMILYSLDPPGMKRVRVIGPGVQDFLWTGLPAGGHFAVQVISVKGHAEASSTIAAEWTCESGSLDPRLMAVVLPIDIRSINSLNSSVLKIIFFIQIFLSIFFFIFFIQLFLSVFFFSFSLSNLTIDH